MYEKPIANNTQNWEKFEAILWSQKCNRDVYYAHSLSILCSSMRRNDRQGRDIKGMQIGKEEVKLSPFADDIILYIYQKSLEIINSAMWEGTETTCISQQVFFIILIENKFFSYTVHPNHSFPSPNSSSPPLLPPSWDPLSLHFLFRKEQDSKKPQSNRTKQYTIKQGKGPHIKAGQNHLPFTPSE